MPTDAALIIPILLAVIGGNLVCLIVLLAARPVRALGDLSRSAMAEGLGSFLLVLAGLVAVQHAALAQGLALAALAAALAPASGGHCHPAVTLGLAFAGKLPAPTAAGYVIAQLIGGVLAALAAGLFGPERAPPAPVPLAGAAFAAALLALTATRDWPHAPVYRGAALAAGLLAFAPAFNPAGWLGAALVGARLGGWQAALGPLLGAPLAGLATLAFAEPAGPRLHIEDEGRRAA